MRCTKSAGIQEQGLLKTNVQSDAFYVVLLLSIVSVIIDLVSSTAMNMASNWWVFQITMTVYVVSMPLLAATWVGYDYVLIHKDDLLGETLKKMSVIMLPYAAYSLLALTNPFTGLFFTLSESIEYKRGVLFMPVGVGFIMLYSFIGLILILLTVRRSFRAIMLVCLRLFWQPRLFLHGYSLQIPAGL